MRKKCVFADCKCRRYESTTCMHCDHGAAWHKRTFIKSSSKEEAIPSICIVCMENNKNSLILPCKHFILCQDCIKKVDDCPYCKTKIDTRICGIFT